jgi:hypothetical protein
VKSVDFGCYFKEEMAKRRMLMKILRATFIVSCMAIVLAAFSSKALCVEPRLIYSQDWSAGSGGWSVGQSLCPNAQTPQRMQVSNPFAEYVIWFDGQCGWGFQSRPIPRVPLKISLMAAVFGSNRNALSVNVRSSGGVQVYKYSFGGNNHIIANNQPPTLYYKDTDLTYKNRVPYELYSIWFPGSGYYLLGIKNLVTGEDKMSAYRWRLRNNLTPAWIDLDQEDGKGPVALGRLDVYLGQ